MKESLIDFPVILFRRQLLRCGDVLRLCTTHIEELANIGAGSSPHMDT